MVSRKAGSRKAGRFRHPRAPPSGRLHPFDTTSERSSAGGSGLPNPGSGAEVYAAAVVEKSIVRAAAPAFGRCFRLPTQYRENTSLTAATATRSPIAYDDFCVLDSSVRLKPGNRHTKQHNEDKRCDDRCREHGPFHDSRLAAPRSESNCLPPRRALRWLYCTTHLRAQSKRPNGQVAVHVGGHCGPCAIRKAVSLQP